MYKGLVKWVKKQRQKGKSWASIYWKLTKMFQDTMYDVEQDEIYESICVDRNKNER